MKPSLPFIPGHAGAGYVVTNGEGVTLLKEGNLVGVPWLHSVCGTGEYCLTGWEILCSKPQNTGFSVDGDFADYAPAPAAYVGHIPEGLGFVEAAPILCAGVTTYKGLKETEARPVQWVAISGIGGLGHGAVQYARAMGLHVAAIDVGDEKLDLARSLGAELTINAAVEDPATALQREIGGAHGVLITAVSPIALSQDLGMARRGGTCVLTGFPPGNPPVPIFDVVLKRLTLRGSIVGTRNDVQEVLQLAAAGAVKATIETQPLEAINDIFARLKKGDVQSRVVLKLNYLKWTVLCHAGPCVSYVPGERRAFAMRSHHDLTSAHHR